MAELHEYKEKRGSCAACGNSPVNHYSAFVFGSLNVIFSDISFYARSSPILGALEKWARILMGKLDAWHSATLSRIRLVTFSDDVSKAKTYRSQVVWEEAQRRGIPMQQVLIAGNPTDLYRAQVRSKWIYFKSLPVPDELEQVSYLWADDKFLLKKALSAVGVAVPDTRSVYTVASARKAFKELGAPLVVKPRAGSRGRHTTTAIASESELVRAFKSARKLNAFVSIESYLEGPVCRGTLVAGKLVGFFAATPPRVVGDGEHTVAQLIEARNAHLPERVQPIVVTDEIREQLARQSLALDSVPPTNTVVSLTHRTGRLFGGETRELLDTVHPKLREQLELAARTLNVPIVGFDLIIPDPEKDPTIQTWGIIEANSLPFIDLHYLPLYGKPSNPASAVWDLWK